MRPVLKWLPNILGAAPPAALSATIKGLALVETNQTLVATQQVAAVSSSPLSLSHPFHSITNISLSTNAPDGGMVAVLWTNALATFSSNSWASVLHAEALNERADLMRSLRRIDLGFGLATGREYYGSDNRIAPWTTVLANCEADFADDGSSSFPHRYMRGASILAFGGDTQYSARAYASEVSVYHNAIPTNVPADVELWLYERFDRIEDPSLTNWFHTFDAYGTSAVESNWFRASSATVTGAMHVTLFGSTNFPSPPTDQPLPPGTRTTRGYNIVDRNWYLLPRFTYP
jgi:hypothetical protein